MLTPPPADQYPGREKIPEQYREYADVFHELTGLVPTPRVRSDWIAEFGVWLSEGIRPADIRQACKEAEGHFEVHRPGSLTGRAAVVHARRSKSAGASKARGWSQREVEIFIRKISRSRQATAEAYRSMNLPFEDPETMRPSARDLRRLLGGAQPPMPRPSAEMRAAWLEKLGVLLGKFSVTGEQRRA